MSGGRRKSVIKDTISIGQIETGVLAEIGHSPFQNRPLLDSKIEFDGIGGL
jgi:hypothetical protein